MEVVKVAPKTGRPPKQGTSRTVDLGFRFTKEEAERIRQCADAMGASRTDAIMAGIDLLEKSLKK